MNLSNEFQRYETSYQLLLDDFNLVKNELIEIKTEFNNIVDENRRLRTELKSVVSDQVSQLSGRLGGSIGADLDQNVIRNLEGQMGMMKKERDHAMQMWQKSLQIISELENDLKSLKFRTAPETMSFEFELKKREEEFARKEINLMREMGMIRAESNQKDEDLMQAKLKQNELKLLIENLNSQLNKKDQERRNMIKKEFGHDDALISLQNDIDQLETKIITLNKENQYLKDSLVDSQSKISHLGKQNAELERQATESKSELDDNKRELIKLKEELKRTELLDLQQKDDHDKLHDAIGELMDEAAVKTRREVESLRKIYNSNLDKLIEECHNLELERNSLAVQLDKCNRARRVLEQEVERITNDHVRTSTVDNLSHEEFHRRFCAMERERDMALTKLESKDTELKKIQSLLDNEKEKSHKIINELSENMHKSNRDLEKLADEHARLLNEIDEIKNKLNQSVNEKDILQKKLTKQIQLHENEIQIKNSDHFNKVKCLEENHSRAMFELRQLLNMQQRMSNKWKEECHAITQQSEAKFNEMKKNFENLRQTNEKINNELQELRRKEVESERKSQAYMSRIKSLETRVKDAENQAGEATKRIAKQLAKEKMLDYERHIMESDLERTKFNDTFSKGKVYLKNLNLREEPVKPNQLDKNDSLSSDN